MDAEVQNAAEHAEQPPARPPEPGSVQPPAQEEPTSPGDRPPGWRSWFRKNDAQVAADEDAPADADFDGADDDAELDDYEGAGPAGPDADDGRRGQPSQPGRLAAFRRQTARPARPRTPLVSRPLVNPRLRADPRLRVWISRLLICLVVFIAVSIWKDWRFAVSATAIVAVADTILRSRTTSITPAAVRVTTAQRATGRRLQVLKAAGYMALHARRIPGTESVIDHIVIGPSGVFIIDSQRMDTRLPVRAIGGMLFHGPNPQTQKIDHARFEAQQAATLIGTELGQRVRVRPTMVVYGPSVPWVIMRLKGVDVFDGKHVSSYFRRQSKNTAGHHLDSAQVALVFAAAAHALPALD